MSYVTLSLVHKIATELTLGMLTLAFLCVLTGYALRLFRYQHTPGWLAALLDDAGLVAASGGIAALVLTVATGLVSWPWERLWATEIVYGKIALASISLAMWVMFLVYRLTFGTVFKIDRQPLVPATLVLGGFLFLILAASAGGHLAHGRSIMDPLTRWLGINPYAPITWNPLASAAIITAVAIYILWPFLIRKKR